MTDSVYEAVFKCRDGYGNLRYDVVLQYMALLELDSPLKLEMFKEIVELESLAQAWQAEVRKREKQ